MLNYLRCERYRVVTSGILGVLAIIFIFGSVGVNVFLPYQMLLMISARLPPRMRYRWR